MATTTPNFGWQVPTSTDYVKDGAVAIETLGDAIDASLVDLKGGTTGQVLSKNTNTDMDFTWVTPNDADAIQNTIVDAKGDLISATAADTPARLAVGTNGHILYADSTTSTGLKWDAPPASGAYTLLSTTSLSGGAAWSTAINSISQAYTHLFVVFVNLSFTSADETPLFRFRNGTTAASHTYNILRSGTTGDYAAQSYIFMTGGNGTNSTKYKSGTPTNSLAVTLYNYTSTSERKSFSAFGGFKDADNNSRPIILNGFLEGTASVDSILINTWADAAITSGTVYVYGVK